MEKKKLQSVGIDLSPGFASVSYVEKGSSFPVSMSVSADDGKYVIPMVLYKKKSIDEWLIGDEAVFAARNGEPENAAESVFEIYRKEEVKYIEGREYTGEQLLKKYLTVLYGRAKELIGFDCAEKIAVTAETPDLRFVQALRRIFSELGVREENLKILGHTESFVYYVLSGKKEIWANDVTLFSLDENRFFCQNMTRRKEKGKSTVFVEEEDLSGLVKYSMLRTEKGMEQADEALLSYLLQDYKTHIVSSVFFTGTGFSENWYKKSVGEICKRRRAFKGFNLYADGAAASVPGENREDLTIFCAGRTILNVSILTEEKGESREYLLSKAGTGWTEAGRSAEFIVDHTDKIQFAVASPFNGDRQVLEIELTDFPDRRDKTMCIMVSLTYKNERNFEITVEDKGFGEFFASSGKVIKKRISL